MLIKHKYRNFQQNLLEKRLIFDGETPDSIAKSFEGKKIEEGKPFDVAFEKQAALDKLNAAAKGNKDEDYNKALARIEAKATQLKAVQDYYVEKVKLGTKADATTAYPAVADARGYDAAMEDAVKFERMTTLQKAGAVADGVDYGAKKTEADKAKKDFTTKIGTDLQSLVKDIDKTMNPKTDEVVAPEQKAVLAEQIKNLENLRKSYLAISAKDKTAFSADISETARDAFALFNLWSATRFNESAKNNPDEKAKKDGREWLVGAESLNKMRSAKANAMASWQKLVNVGDGAASVRADLQKADSPAQMAWVEAKTLEDAQKDYTTATKKYAEAGQLYQAGFEKLNDNGQATAAKSAAEAYWDQNVKGKSFEEAARTAGDGHWKLADAAMSATPPNFLAAKTNFDLAKTDYENFVKNESLKSGKTEADVKRSEGQFNAAKASFETAFKGYPERTTITNDLLRKFAITANDSNDLKFIKFNESTRICNEAVTAIAAWQADEDAYKAHGVKDTGASRLYDEAEACFKRGDFASATDKYNQAAKIYKNSTDNPEFRKKNTAVDDKGVVREFTQAESLEAYNKIANAMGEFPDMKALLQPHFDSAKLFSDKGSFAGAYSEYREISRLVEGAKAARVVKDKVGGSYAVGEAAPTGLKLGTVDLTIFSDQQKDWLAVNSLKAQGDYYFNAGNFASAKSIK